MININSFASRHIGPRNEDIAAMLKIVNCKSLDVLIKKTVPEHILFTDKLKLKPGMSEDFNKVNMQLLSLKNKFKKTYIGLGYHNTITPSVILRNILENPGWYTAYTPYQPEIAQGRLEALLNFQTMVCDITKMEIANASLLDEGTSAAEAMIMMYNNRSKDQKSTNQNKFYVDSNIFPQTLAVLSTRAKPLNIELVVGNFNELNEICWDFMEKELVNRFYSIGGTCERKYEKMPHNVGHLIAHSVHDGDPQRAYKQEPLESGMVITVEPGLYGRFECDIDGVLYVEHCGIRIEDNVMVTDSGVENLTSIPKTISDLEALFK